MYRWVKNAVMLTALCIWAVYMLTYLVRGILPDPALWGVPGAIWLALNPPFISNLVRKSKQTTPSEPQESEQ